MDFLLYPLSFIFVLGVIIFVHEFGHFITAKAFGMKVFIFSFGFGRRLFGFTWGGTDCRVSLIPLGGYVKLEGEPDDRLSQDGPSDVRVLDDGSMQRVESPHYFLNRPRWQRFLVYLAGPAMNAALTIGVMTVFHLIGFGVDATLYDPPIIGAVGAGSPAAAAGLAPGDEIRVIDDRPVRTWEEAYLRILLRPDVTVRLLVRRGGEERAVELRSGSTGSEKAGSIDVTPLVRIGSVRAGSPAEAAGLRPDDGLLAVGGEPIRSFGDLPPLVQRSAGRPLAVRVYRDAQVLDLEITPLDSGSGPQIGIGSKTVIKKYGLARSVRESVAWTWGQVRFTFETIGRLFSGALSPKSMMGPLGIAKASGERAREGAASLFFLIAVISLQVGILNLFPLAPLDGGHLAILATEGLVRRDLSMAVKAWIMNAGVLVLFLLIGLVLYSDLSKTSLLGKYLP
jgi:regulator of sigma E protease